MSISIHFNRLNFPIALTALENLDDRDYLVGGSSDLYNKIDHTCKKGNGDVELTELEASFLLMALRDDMVVPVAGKVDYEMLDHWRDLYGMILGHVKKGQGILD